MIGLPLDPVLVDVLGKWPKADGDEHRLEVMRLKNMGQS